jgi:hypothetical protein
MHKSAAITFGVLLALCPAISQPRVAIIQLRETKPAAEKALASLKIMATPANYKSLGFETMAEVSEAVLGSPIRVFMVRLDHLKGYRAGQNPDSLLVALDEVVFPVNIRDQARSALSLEKVGAIWRPRALGDAPLIKKVAPIRENLARTFGLDQAGISLVKIPALNYVFLGYRSQDRLFLALIYGPIRPRLRVGESLPAATVFEMLLPEAQAHDGLPR